MCVCVCIGYVFWYIYDYIVLKIEHVYSSLDSTGINLKVPDNCKFLASVFWPDEHIGESVRVTQHCWLYVCAILTGINYKRQESEDILRNYNERRQCSWYSASCKHTCPSRIPVASTGAGSRTHWSLLERQHKRVHVILLRRSHLHSEWWSTEIRRQFHVPRQQ